MTPSVSIIMGSTSDLPVMEKACKLLNDLKVSFEVNALSAHRTPDAVEAFAKGAKTRGVKVIIAAAGMAGPPPADGRRTPVTTYRLQMGSALTFDDARDLVPYLQDLGVTDISLSPVLAAAPGSTHGYDVVDHTRISEVMGGRPGLERLAADVHAAGMGLVLDIVPNHMAVPAPAAEKPRGNRSMPRGSPAAGRMKTMTGALITRFDAQGPAGIATTLRDAPPGSAELPPVTPTLASSIGERLSESGLSDDEVRSLVGLDRSRQSPFLPVSARSGLRLVTS